MLRRALPLLLLTPALAMAQEPVVPPPAGARTVVGVVVDTLGRRLDSVDVFIARLKRRISTDSTGAFRFSEVKPDSYTVGARKLGFYPQTREVRVGPDGAVAMFELVPLMRILPTVVSRTSRGGLSGVIGDTAFNAVPEAEIRVLTAGVSVKSDSAGSFHTDVKPGSYMVRVTRVGYRSRTVSVTIPRDSGQRIMVFLVPSETQQTAREGVFLFDMAMRMNRRAPNSYRMLSREDIVKSGLPELRDLVRMAQGGSADDDCMALVDGGVRRYPLWLLNANDVEAVEVIRATPPRATRRSIMGNQAMRQQRPSDDQGFCPTVYVWLRH